MLHNADPVPCDPPVRPSLDYAYDMLFTHFTLTKYFSSCLYSENKAFMVSVSHYKKNLLPIFLIGWTFCPID